MKSNCEFKKDINSLTYNYKDDNIFVLESIIEQFIPYFKEINSCIVETNQNNIFRLIQDLIVFLSKMNNPLNCKNKKKKFMYNNDNNGKYEEKEFLYKTYISSSDKNDGTVKFFSDESLNINNVTSHMVRGLLILIKEELNNNNSNNILLEKLRNVKKIIINESKAFDFKILFILLNFIILKYCVNLVEINFEGIFYSRIDQIDVMIKNGVYLHFIYMSKKITKFTITNKIEFLNENVAYKHLHEYCYKNNVTNVNIDSVEFNRINIFSILSNKNNIQSLNVCKISLDKNSTINSIVEIISKNKNLCNLKIDKLVSIPDYSKKEILTVINNLKFLTKLKLNIISSIKSDLQFLNIPGNNSSIEKFSMKLSRISIEANDYDDLFINNFSFHKTNLQKLSLQFEKFAINFINSSSLLYLIPKNLKEISIALIDHNFLNEFVKLSPEDYLYLKSLKLSFLPINDDQYDNSHKNILQLIDNCKLLKKLQFDNYVMKYKNIFDDEIKNTLKNNLNLKKLIIRSELPFHVQYIEGLFYYEYPKFLINPLLFSLKKNIFCKRIYHKKPIVSKIFEFHRIKKEKTIVVSYKI